MTGHLRLLTEDQIEEIHSATLEILREPGIAVENPEALRLLREAGCEVEGPPEAIWDSPSRRRIELWAGV